MNYDFPLRFDGKDPRVLLAQCVHKNSTVLEFGPATGCLTHYLQAALECKVYLVELDEEALEIAKQYAVGWINADIEKYEWLEEYKDIKFDYIFFTDVLEHLRDPQKVLNESKMLLARDGKIMISVPNMAHNSVLIDLMNNKLDYMDAGLLDRTHIHFFARESLERMIGECGLVPERRMSTNAPVGTTEIKNTTSSVAGIDEIFWNGREYGEVYQFVYILGIKEEEKEQESINDIQVIAPHYCSQIFYWKVEDQMDAGFQNRKIGIGIKNPVIRLRFYDLEETKEIRLNFIEHCSIVRLDSVHAYFDGNEIETVILSDEYEVRKQEHQEIYVFDNAFSGLWIRPANLEESISELVVEGEFVSLSQETVDVVKKFFVKKEEKG